tara:strand:+ start:1236 stop:2021 length:786 start_codon:yes stop_codon:yes gene_type:complete
MTNFDQGNALQEQLASQMPKDTNFNLALPETREKLTRMKAEERLEWAHKKFGRNFVLTTSFGIQSAVLLNMISNLRKEQTPQVIWVDTGYLPLETYVYAEKLINQLKLNIKVSQSALSPARMEALYGKLWETNSVKDLEKYHQIRKINPLEETFNELKTICWGSGVRSSQTSHRNSMTYLDPIRGRLSLRPILEWTPKDIFYYMKENDLPQHPLFDKGYTTVGDWHSSGPDIENDQGRNTRFGGLKEECGIHLPPNNEIVN